MMQKQARCPIHKCFVGADGCKRCKPITSIVAETKIVDEPSSLSKLDLLESELRIKRLELKKETKRLNREILKVKKEIRLGTITCTATDCAFIKLSNGYVVPGCNNHHNCNMSSVVKNGNAKTEIKIATIRSRVDKISWFDDDIELKKYILAKETSSTDCGTTFYCIEILLNPMNNFSGIGTHEQGKKLFDDLMDKVIKTLASSMVKSKNNQLVKMLSRNYCDRDSCSHYGQPSNFINCDCQYAKPYIETIKKQNYVGSHLDFKFSYEFENKAYEELFKTEILKSETSSYCIGWWSKRPEITFEASGTSYLRNLDYCKTYKEREWKSSEPYSGGGRWSLLSSFWDEVPDYGNASSGTYDPNKEP